MRYFARDFVEDPNLQIEKFRIVNLPALSTKLNLEHRTIKDSKPG